ncbi:hypothetical protein VT84_24475 [Gemmata sp. SH-PL17]|uniref:hypothetical protein n=1 Tax=Gemmata sp. SH-PL17 TaxID=1630693 RepID=UPI0004AF3622|nr:hypothetical protein [Gemmata sp. SH-PL17]AMV27580.1 hypothetical protein VT84_24475 [Gemmata sp. SH-PL17]
MPPLIREAPAYRWPALQTQTVRVECTLRAGLSLSDYGTVTLTVRQDPEWPRSGPARTAVDAANPRSDGWPIAAFAVGAIDAGATNPTIVFTVTVPAVPGYRRYALDVVASGGIAGRVQLVDTTWLTVVPSLLG